MTIPGVDVSSFQGEPSKWKAAAGDYQWVAVKVTELMPDGTKYVNPDAGNDWSQAHVDGKGRLAYLFGHPKTSAAATVDLFLTELDKLGLEDGDGVALDLETNDGGVRPAEVAAWAKDVETQLASKLHRTPLLYTFVDFAKAGNCAGLSKYPLWIADPSTPAGKPVVPGPWKAWAIHQYAIKDNIDRDVANFSDLAAFRAAVGKPTAPSTGDKPMKFISRVQLDGNQEIRVGKAVVPLKWKAITGKADLLVKGSTTRLNLGAQTVFSVAQVQLGAGTKVRFVLTGYDAKGKELGQLARDYDFTGGWVDIVLPLEADAGCEYEFAVINMSDKPLTFANGTWLVIA